VSRWPAYLILLGTFLVWSNSFVAARLLVGEQVPAAERLDPLAFVAASYENGVGAFTLDHLPTATNLDQALSYTEDTGPVALNDIVVADLDAGDPITATLTLANPAAGALTTSAAETKAIKRILGLLLSEDGPNDL